jgi:hypothetical protein
MDRPVLFVNTHAAWLESYIYLHSSLSRITARNTTLGVVPACVGALEDGRTCRRW